MAEAFVLAHEGGAGAVGDHEARVQPGVCGKESRQTADAGVHQALKPTEV